MKKLLAALVASAMLTLAMASSVAAQFGDQPCETGREFAEDHIAHAAQLGLLGQVHKPGEHLGFSGVPDVCF